MKAVLCPVCGGKGILNSWYDGLGNLYQNKTCHGCEGKGWVAVPEGWSPDQTQVTGGAPK